MTDTTDRAPWCPRCGNPLMHDELIDPVDMTAWRVGCEACGFSDRDENTHYFGQDFDSALFYARRLIRAELARQALEMRAHSAAQAMNHTQNSVYKLDDNVQCVMNDYNWLGAHPLRLPGEGA